MENTKVNTGALFAVQEKLSDKHPTHTGVINVMGQEFAISAWVNTAKNGRRYFSLNVRPKYPAQLPVKAPLVVNEADPFDDNIPF